MTLGYLRTHKDFCYFISLPLWRRTQSLLALSCRSRISLDFIRLVWWLICARASMCLVLFRLNFSVLGLGLFLQVQLALRSQ